MFYISYDKNTFFVTQFSNVPPIHNNYIVLENEDLNGIENAKGNLCNYKVIFDKILSKHVVINTNKKNFYDTSIRLKKIPVTDIKSTFTIINNFKKKLWIIKYNADFSLEQLPTDAHISICEIDNPNNLIRLLSINLIKVKTQKEIEIPFLFNKEKDPNLISIFIKNTMQIFNYVIYNE
jgi:hypothetical protein